MHKFIDLLVDHMKNVTYKTVMKVALIFLLMLRILLRQDVTAFIIQDPADVLGICGTTRNTLYEICC